MLLSTPDFFLMAGECIFGAFLSVDRDLSPGPLVLITARLLSPPLPVIGYLYLSREAPWGLSMYIHHFDGALFIRMGQAAEIYNLYYSCGLRGVRSAGIDFGNGLN